MNESIFQTDEFMKEFALQESIDTIPIKRVEEITRRVRERLGPSNGNALNLLMRGIGVNSPRFETAERGVAAIGTEYVADDYKQLNLPAASYWVDSENKIYGVFTALEHAFGGDHPQSWSDAQAGIILTSEFALNSISSNQAEIDHTRIKSGNTAWIVTGLPVQGGTRGERLVFHEKPNCIGYRPVDLLKSAFDSNEARVVLAVAYARYLKDKIRYNGVTNPARKRANALIANLNIQFPDPTVSDVSNEDLEGLWPVSPNELD